MVDKLSHNSASKYSIRRMLNRAALSRAKEGQSVSGWIKKLANVGVLKHQIGLSAGSRLLTPLQSHIHSIWLVRYEAIT